MIARWHTEMGQPSLNRIARAEIESGSRTPSRISGDSWFSYARASAGSGLAVQPWSK